MSAVEAYLVMKTAAKKKEPPLSLPGTVAAGTTAGAVTGGSMGLLKNFRNLITSTQLEGKLPELELERSKLKAKGLDNRRQLRNLLIEKKLQYPPEIYYDLRKGYEKGLLERSRVAKTLKALKNISRKSMLRHTLAGTGIGLGAGLLGATAFGHFD